MEFYDALAEHQHLIFADWNASIVWQAGVFGPLLEKETGCGRLRILDCSCGIGTQALGLAARGHQVVAADLSRAAVARAEREAAQRNLSLTFHVADMRNLSGVPDTGFDAVLTADNALPHLMSEEELLQAARAAAAKLRPGGIYLATMRDYDQVLAERPAQDPPRFFRDQGRRRIVHQVWDWVDERVYVLHQYITWESDCGWESLHQVSRYRALPRSELSRILEDAGFAPVRWLMPPENGFYQPMVLAVRTPR